MRNCCKVVNPNGINSEKNIDETHFEVIYNEKLHSLTNHSGYSCPNYPRSGGNQGWNSDCDNGWIDLDKK